MPAVTVQMPILIAWIGLNLNRGEWNWYFLGNNYHLFTSLENKIRLKSFFSIKVAIDGHGRIFRQHLAHLWRWPLSTCCAFSWHLTEIHSCKLWSIIGLSSNKSLTATLKGGAKGVAAALASLWPPLQSRLSKNRKAQCIFSSSDTHWSIDHARTNKWNKCFLQVRNMPLKTGIL